MGLTLDWGQQLFEVGVSAVDLLNDTLELVNGQVREAGAAETLCDTFWVFFEIDEGPGCRDALFVRAVHCSIEQGRVAEDDPEELQGVIELIEGLGSKPFPDQCFELGDSAFVHVSIVHGG